MVNLTHLDTAGNARMVNVGEKTISARSALARGYLTLSPEALAAVESRSLKKGDPISIAQLAGIMAAKKTSDLIPLCHPLPLSKVEVTGQLADDQSQIEITASVSTTGQTGVEMEALTAVSVACLSLYDMLKAIDKGLEIGPIHLVKKTGGKSGDFARPTSK